MILMNKKMRSSTFDKGNYKAFPLTGWRIEVYVDKRVGPDKIPLARNLVLYKDNISFGKSRNLHGIEVFKLTPDSSGIFTVAKATYLKSPWMRMVNENGFVITGDVGSMYSPTDLKFSSASVSPNSQQILSYFKIEGGSV